VSLQPENLEGCIKVPTVYIIQGKLTAKFVATSMALSWGVPLYYINVGQALTGVTFSECVIWLNEPDGLLGESKANKYYLDNIKLRIDSSASHLRLFA
jgi:hypothetical protein